MKTRQFDGEAILAKYPDDKPVCVNYVEMCGDMSALHEENLRLQKRLEYFEEGLNPDAAVKFAARADNLLENMDSLISGPTDKKRLKADIISEISQFLQDAGFEEASKALDCHYEL